MKQTFKLLMALAVIVTVSTSVVSCDKLLRTKEYPYSSSLVVTQTETRGQGHLFVSTIDLKGGTKAVSGGMMTTLPGESAVTAYNEIVLSASADVNFASSDDNVIKVKKIDARSASLIYKSDGEAFIRVFFAEPGDGIDIPYDSRNFIPVEAIRFWMSGYNCDIGDKEGWRFAPEKDKYNWFTTTEPFDTINTERAQLVWQEYLWTDEEGNKYYNEMYDATGRTLEKFTLWPLNASQVDGWNYVQNNPSFYLDNFDALVSERWKDKMTSAGWQWIQQLPNSKIIKTENNNLGVILNDYSFTEMEGLKGPATEIARARWPKMGGTYKLCPEDFYFYVEDIDGKEKYFCVRHTSYDDDWYVPTDTRTCR